MNAVTLALVLQLLLGDPSALAAGGSFVTAAPAGRDSLAPAAQDSSAPAARDPLAPPAARAGTTPSAAMLADLRERARAAPLRLTTASGSWILSRAQFDSSGVRATEAAFVRPSRGAIVQVGAPPVTPPELPEVVGWDSVRRIEAGRSEWRKGAFGGFVLWSLVAVATYPLAVWLLAYSPTYPDAAFVLAGSLAAAVGGGAALGATSTTWETVWAPAGSEPWIPERPRRR